MASNVIIRNADLLRLRLKIEMTTLLQEGILTQAEFDEFATKRDNKGALKANEAIVGATARLGETKLNKFLQLIEELQPDLGKDIAEREKGFRVKQEAQESERTAVQASLQRSVENDAASNSALPVEETKPALPLSVACSEENTDRDPHSVTGLPRYALAAIAPPSAAAPAADAEAAATPGEVEVEPDVSLVPHVFSPEQKGTMISRHVDPWEEFIRPLYLQFLESMDPVPLAQFCYQQHLISSSEKQLVTSAGTQRQQSEALLQAIFISHWCGFEVVLWFLSQGEAEKRYRVLLANVARMIKNCCRPS